MNSIREVNLDASWAWNFPWSFWSNSGYLHCAGKQIASAKKPRLMKHGTFWTVSSLSSSDRESGEDMSWTKKYWTRKMQMPTGGRFWCLVVYSRGRFPFPCTTCLSVSSKCRNWEACFSSDTNQIHHLILLYLQIFQNDTYNCKLQLQSLFRWLYSVK